MTRVELALCAFSCFGFAMTMSPQEPVGREAKVVIVPPNDSYSGDVIAIPLETSVRFTIGMSPAPQKRKPLDPTAKTWLLQTTATNGLGSTELRPWHALISFEAFDEDGDMVNAGTFEEFWVSAKKYREIYKSDKLNQADFSTEQGVFREGDQRWPNRDEAQIREKLLLPFAEMQGVDFSLHESPEQFGAHTLQCDSVEVEPGQMGLPRKFCFDGSGALRYVRGAGWLQIAYNTTSMFQGRRIATDVFVGDGPKAHLNLHLVTLNQLATIDDTMFVPPADALKLSDEVTGVPVRAKHSSFPEWPNSVRGQHLKVVVEILIGKDGRVESAKALSGPAECFKAAEKTAKQWTFEPYLVQGEPVKVRFKIELTQN